MLAPIAIRGPAAWIVSASTGARARVRLVGHRAASHRWTRINPAKAGSPRSRGYRARRVAGADCVGRVAAGGCDRAGDCTCRHSPADRTPGDLRLGVHAAEAGNARSLARGVRVHPCADRGTRLHARLPARDVAGPRRSCLSGVGAVCRRAGPAAAAAGALAGETRLNPEFALDGYAAVDPSFRIARDMLASGTSGDAAEFYAYLRAHSAIENTHIEPVDIDFVHGLARSNERSAPRVPVHHRQPAPGLCVSLQRRRVVHAGNAERSPATASSSGAPFPATRAPVCRCRRSGPDRCSSTSSTSAVCSDERARKARRREGLSPPHHGRSPHRGALCAIAGHDRPGSQRARDAAYVLPDRCGNRPASRGPAGRPAAVRDDPASGSAHREDRQREGAAGGVLSRVSWSLRGARSADRRLLWRARRHAEAICIYTTTASSCSRQITAIRSAKGSDGDTGLRLFRKC